MCKEDPLMEIWEIIRNKKFNIQFLFKALIIQFLLILSFLRPIFERSHTGMFISFGGIGTDCAFLGLLHVAEYLEVIYVSYIALFIQFLILLIASLVISLFQKNWDDMNTIPTLLCGIFYYVIFFIIVAVNIYIITLKESFLFDILNKLFRNSSLNIYIFMSAVINVALFMVVAYVFDYIMDKVTRMRASEFVA